ncbi:MAG: GlpM family protein [Armatimonadota bacterium]
MIFLKAVIGGVLTAAIATFAKSRLAWVAGVIPLFPIFGLIALHEAGEGANVARFHAVVAASLKTVPAYCTFLLSAYVLVPYVDYRLALIVSALLWAVVAVLTFRHFPSA